MTKSLLLVALAFVVAGAGCASRVDLEKVPVGTEVEVTRRDGGVVRGTLSARDDRTVTVRVDSTNHEVPRDQITGVQVVGEAAKTGVDDTRVVPAAVASSRDFTLPPGTMLVVQLDSPVSSDSSRAGDPIAATLTHAVIVDGTEVFPAGSVVRGEVASAHSAGKVKGRGSLALVFSSVSVADRDGSSYPIAARVGRTARATKGRDTAKIALPAAGGALIGGLLGGRKGVAIGSAIGGGTGTVVVLSTRGRQVRLPRGTSLTLRLDDVVEVRVPTNASGPDPSR